jgi:hypothetical protein
MIGSALGEGKGRGAGCVFVLRAAAKPAWKYLEPRASAVFLFPPPGHYSVHGLIAGRRRQFLTVYEYQG